MYKLILSLIVALVFSISSLGDDTRNSPQAGEFGLELLAPTFGAISYSPSTGIYGRSWNWASLPEAEAVANDYCAQPDCRIIVWVSRGCAALAVAQQNRGLWGWAWASSLPEAEGHALMECNSLHGPCYVKTSVCTN